MNFESKYLKYKSKYLQLKSLKNMKGGAAAAAADDAAAGRAPAYEAIRLQVSDAFVAKAKEILRQNKIWLGVPDEYIENLKYENLVEGDLKLEQTHKKINKRAKLAYELSIMAGDTAAKALEFAIASANMHIYDMYLMRINSKNPTILANKINVYKILKQELISKTPIVTPVGPPEEFKINPELKIYRINAGANWFPLRPYQEAALKEALTLFRDPNINIYEYDNGFPGEQQIKFSIIRENYRYYLVRTDGSRSEIKLFEDIIWRAIARIPNVIKGMGDNIEIGGNINSLKIYNCCRYSCYDFINYPHEGFRIPRSHMCEDGTIATLYGESGSLPTLIRNNVEVIIIGGIKY